MDAGDFSLNATAAVWFPFIPSNGIDVALKGTLKSNANNAWSAPCVLTEAADVSAWNYSYYECDTSLLQKVGWVWGGDDVGWGGVCMANV